MNNNGSKHRGSILIMVLLVSVILAALGSALLPFVTLETGIAFNYYHNMRAYYLAEAGVEATLALLKNLNYQVPEDLTINGLIGGGEYQATIGTLESGGLQIISSGSFGKAREEVQVNLEIEGDEEGAFHTRVEWQRPGS